MAENREKKLICGFCGAEATRNSKVPFFPSTCFDGLAICGNCLRNGATILEAEERRRAERNDPVAALSVPSPVAIKEELDRFVIGQEATRTMWRTPRIIRRQVWVPLTLVRSSR